MASGLEGEVETMGWDCFIAYAGEDRASVVDPLARELLKRSVQVWYDQWELKVGDSLSRKIDAGLSESAYGVVVLSPNFFGKGWPERGRFTTADRTEPRPGSRRLFISAPQAPRT